MPYERERIRRAAGYVPGEQPESGDSIKLNTNENPYPPPPAVRAALADFDARRLHRYPHPTARAFREVAARLHRLSPDHVIATNGGDELLRLALTTFVEPGEPIGIAAPSYTLYEVLAEIHGAGVERVPLNDDWSPPDDLAKRLNAAGVRLTLLVNPHAPSGRLTDAGTLAAIAGELRGVLLIDEAYVDFVDPERRYDAVRLIEGHDNVLILRTLSKGYSLAGLRFGYGLGAQSLIAPMQLKTKDSYNTDAVSQALAVAALENRDQACATWEAVRDQRRWLQAELAHLGLGCAPSQANFLLALVGRELGGAEAVYRGLKRRNILVRYFDQQRLRDRLRITVGTPDQNRALVDALAELAG